MKNNPFDTILDMYGWFWLQGWFMPYYVIGKQDEWKDYFTSVTLNGLKPINLCRPN